MTKSNPLFVDSTKFHGDLISTHIELRRALVYDGEIVYAVVCNHQGVTRKLPMRLMESGGFEARVHLNHQTPVTYQFVIEKDGQRFLSTPTRKGRAQYALIEDWEPVLDNETDILVETPQSEMLKPKAPGPAAETNESWARESVMNVKSLMDKWGL